MSGNVKNAGRLDQMLKKYASSSFSQNEIGASKMLDSPFEGGAQPMLNQVRCRIRTSRCSC